MSPRIQDIGYLLDIITYTHHNRYEQDRTVCGCFGALNRVRLGIEWTDYSSDDLREKHSRVKRRQTRWSKDRIL